MKRLHFHSFRQRLNAAFLAVSLAPLLLCSALLLQIFRFRMTADQQQNAQQQLDGACYAVDTMHEGLASAAAALQKSRTVLRALSGGQADSAAVYSVLFDATEPVRRFARFDLYDADGTLRYSTQTAPDDRFLPTDWGILHEAAQAKNGRLVYIAGEESSSDQVLHGAVLLSDRYGAPTGYLVVSVSAAGFRSLLGGAVGVKNELALLSRFFRPVYCTRPAILETMADKLRAQLLAGEALTGLSEDYVYSICRHPATGLYVVLQQPEVFTRDTMRLLYTVSAACALVCIGVIGYSVTAAGKVPFLATSAESETIIIKLADLMSQHGVLLAVMAGIILSGILAATMSTADSQLLAAASSVSQDLMQHSFGIKMNQRTTMLAARATVICIAIIGMVLAWDPNSSVFRVVSFAWAGFGAAFGPVMLFSLFWKRANKQGALAGMITGGAVVFIWKYLIAPMGGAWAIYELLPAFLAACIAIVIVSLATPAPEKAVTDTFDEICGK